jgi:hypothetical protein
VFRGDRVRRPRRPRRRWFPLSARPDRRGEERWRPDSGSSAAVGALTRTKREGPPVLSRCKAAAIILRASDLRAGTTPSSRSKIATSTSRPNAFSTIFVEWPGTNSQDLARSMLTPVLL